MFKVRREQMDAYRKAALRDFEERMRVHLAKFYPEQCAALGADQVARMIRYGIERAASHGITTERGVCIYVDVMFAFGRDFDRDPAVPWAREIFARGDIVSQRGLASCLLSHAIDHRHEARGIRPEEAPP